LQNFEIRKKIKNQIKAFIEKNFTDSEIQIGLISYKEFLKPFNGEYYPYIFIPDKYRNVKFLHFGNTEGKNKLENVDLLIIIGTYLENPTEMKKRYESLYGRKINSQAVKTGLFYLYQDEDYNDYYYARQKTNWYQDIHRVRPARKEKTILCFSIVPEKIKKEFDFKYLRIKDSEITEYEVNPIEAFVEFVKEKGNVSKREAAEWLLKQYTFFGASLSNLYNRIDWYVKRSPYLSIAKGKSTGGRPPQLVKYNDI
jgi:hypothetical protein